MSRKRLAHLIQIGFWGLAIGSTLLVSACMDTHVRLGRRPNTDILESSLRIGESSRADVLAALGEPLGKGRTMLPIDPKPRTIWSYQYAEAGMKDARGMFLFIYFDEDRYHGYMWYSSLPR